MYNRKDLAVKVSIKSIKGYTMKEIGALEDRIRRLEYYTVLNALELDTKTLSVRDATGTLERFKNGIFADPFNDHTLGKTTDREYSIAVSSERSIARPTFDQLFGDFKLKISSSTNVRTGGRLAMINWTDEVYAENPYATTYRNCTEAYYKWKGFCQIFPNVDNQNEVTNLAPQNVTVDVAGAFSDLLALGIAQDIDTVQGARTLTGSSVTQNPDGGTTTVNYFSQTAATTVKDIQVNVKTINQDMGSFVKDVSILPYMRSRVVAIIGRGMRPGIRVYPFFDKVAVSQYVSPAKINPSYADINGDLDNTKLANLSRGRENEVLLPNGSKGDAIYSDARGEVYCLFYIPSSTFRAGDRTFTLTNVDDLAATGAVLTTAEGVYSSSSLAVSQQQLSFTVLQPQFTPVSTTSYATTNSSETIVWNPPPPPDTTQAWDGGRDGGGGGSDGNDPIGQSFIINSDKTVAIPGIYLTQIGTYFKSKSQTLGITCVVVSMTAGVPDVSKILGRCHLSSAQVVTSENSSSETIFTFESPILLQSDSQFAFYLMPDGDNPDYEVWISEVGGNDILTGRSINSQPYVGVMFVSSNGRSWNAIQSSDLKFKLYRARFLSQTATAVFTNEQDDYLTLSNLIRTNTGNPIEVGDVVYSANIANPSQTMTDTALKPFGIVQYVDELNNIMYLDNSNGLFNNTVFKNIRVYRVPEIGNPAFITPTYLVANGVINTVDDIIYHGLVPKFNLLEPIGTLFTMNFLGSANSTGGYSKDITPLAVKNEALFELNDYERVLRSYSNEVADGGYTDGSATFTVNFQTASPYLSPVIDLGSKTFNFIKNRINNDLTNENTRYGNALNKYISKNVILTQEAEDLLVYVTGYRPAGTDIVVYGKFLNESDQDLFDNKEWTLLEHQTDYLYSSPQDRDDYKELIYGVFSGNTVVNQTTAYLDPATTPEDIITYYDEAGGVYQGFSNFCIKIVLISDDPVKIPMMRDVRAIALQK